VKKSLIITADDFGMSESVNAAIKEGISNKIITTTNVMVNMPHSNDAAALRMEFPNASIGLHWTISAGKPVSKPDAAKTLIDGDGNFFSQNIFLKRYKDKLINTNELILELKNQYNRFNEICGKPDYWNTHQNTHVNLMAFDLFLSTAFEYGMKKMRWHAKIWSDEVYKSLSFKRSRTECGKTMVLNHWKKKATAKMMKSPDGLLAMKNSIHSLLDENVNVIWGRAEIGELVIHPAKSVDSPYFGSMTESRIKEYSTISNMDSINSILNKYKLVGFENL
jgi:predicted glycoside hydrolase/deacetylase ChbG (UPF0249 family)